MKHLEYGRDQLARQVREEAISRSSAYMAISVCISQSVGSLTTRDAAGQPRCIINYWHSKGQRRLFATQTVRRAGVCGCGPTRTTAGIGVLVAKL